MACTYLFTTISLYMRFIWTACHWQNRQLASITPRITTRPFDRASANGFSWPIVHEGGRLHLILILEPSVSTKNESEAKRSVVATARMVSEKGKDVTSRTPMSSIYSELPVNPLLKHYSLLQSGKATSFLALFLAPNIRGLLARRAFFSYECLALPSYH